MSHERPIVDVGLVVPEEDRVEVSTPRKRLWDFAGPAILGLLIYFIYDLLRRH